MNSIMMLSSYKTNQRHFNDSLNMCLRMLSGDVECCFNASRERIKTDLDLHKIDGIMQAIGIYYKISKCKN